VRAYLHAALFEIEQFLTPTAEDVGVPPLEADDGHTVLGKVEEEVVDVLLAGGVEAAAFTDVDKAGARVGEGEDVGGDQAIVEDDVGSLEKLDGAEGKEGGVAGAGPDEVNVADGGRGRGGGGIRAGAEQVE
jgi:hypothetical protein